MFDIAGRREKHTARGFHVAAFVLFASRKCYSTVDLLVRFKGSGRKSAERQIHGGRERGTEENTRTCSGRQGETCRREIGGGKWLQSGRERAMARGHPWVICFGPLRAQTHKEQVNQLQCDMNH